MVQKMLKSMKKWTSYALWKWRGWFAKTGHNSLVCVFKFKLFVCCSIASDIQTNFVILFLAHPMVQKMLKLMKNWTSYALWKWRWWFAKTELNNLIFIFEFNFLYIVPLPSTLKKNCTSPLGASNIIKLSQFDKEMRNICSLKLKWGDSNMN
jgi:hypothetical protein